MNVVEPIDLGSTFGLVVFDVMEKVSTLSLSTFAILNAFEWLLTLGRLRSSSVVLLLLLGLRKEWNTVKQRRDNCLRMERRAE